MGVEVCPVHRAELKSTHISSIHVGAMSCNSQSGGLKRKRPDDEDEDEDPPSAPSRRQQHCDLRQQVLDLTYSKLERFRQAPDSSLCRYVLIINTIRNLEQDMLKDGIKIGPPNGSFVPAANHQVPFDPSRPPPPDDAKTSLNSLDEALSSVSYSSNPYVMDSETRTATTTVISPSDTSSDIFGSASSGVSYPTDYDRYLMEIDSPSSGRATPFVRSDVESGALWNDDSDRLTSLNWSSVLKMVDGGAPLAVSSPYSETAIDSSTLNCNYDVSSNSSSGCSECSISDDAMSNSETSLHTLMPVTTGIPTCINTSGVISTSSSSSPKVTSALGNASSQSGSSPPSSEDEIFADIDVALYDYDFMPVSPPNVKMAPVTAEELLHNLSANQNLDSFHTNNFHKKEFCSDEREHLTSVRT